MIAEFAVRTSAVLAAGLVLRAALVRQSAALRHSVVAVTLLCSALVVPASLVLPSWTIAMSVPARPVPAAAIDSPTAARAAATARTADSVPSVSRRSIAPLVWTAGFLVVIGTLVAGVSRLRQIAARGIRVEAPAWTETARAVGAAYGLRRGVVLIEGTSPFVVATWGLRPARVLLPPGASSWDDARIHAVLAHELAHVARADWAVQIASQVVLAALWFHPLAWIACRQLRRESEQACDDAALQRGIDPPEYASHLIALARLCRRPSWSAWMPALPVAHPSAFERRIAAMLNSHLDRRPLSRRTAVAYGTALVAVACVVAVLHAAQAPPAALSGSVYDPSGGVLPGVALTLSAPQGPGVQATTDGAGHFAFPGIPAGHYSLSAAVPGFHNLHEDFDLTTASDWDRAVTLPVGTVRETIHVSATRTPPAAAAVGPAPIRVGGNLRAPMKVRDVKPVYPESMRAAGREADVQIEATIAPDGSVSAVHVVSTQTHPDFASAAIDAVRQWRFSPTLLNGKPIEVVMTVTVSFGLSD
ncbi:MAG TPA: M56 family metallopeptidase [Vicinamibacterales bacterium]|jgi:TonB family protein